MIKIYHNPRCSKSREGLSILEESGKDFEVIEYMKNSISENELVQLIEKLKIKPIDLIRKSESVWKEIYKNQDLNDQQIIQAMVEHPQLIERPILTNGKKAIIGRPSVLINDIL